MIDILLYSHQNTVIFETISGEYPDQLVTSPTIVNYLLPKCQAALVSKNKQDAENLIACEVGQAFQIFAQTTGGKTITITVRSIDEKVMTVKNKIEDSTGVPYHRIRIAYGEKQLEDKKKHWVTTVSAEEQPYICYVHYEAAS
jgi:predicted DNA binding CopG/RHH family protein